ncbi:acyl-CoA dehydrogenase [Paenibacillus sp. GXUN7292]|uniref:acyl-CoA dehydrogenase n=1 Tax=Paenibacillus sp. GXUN7292 TaxID=3422499 RepID=UPI003D7E6A7C
MNLKPNMIDQIRSVSLQSENEGGLARDALNLILERNWFKLFVPKALGGEMAALPDALKIFEYASWVDGSFGWLTTIGAGGGYFAAFMQPDTAKSVFSPPQAVIAGSGAPTGTAVRTEGGYIVNGKWSFCSGSEHATTFTANCIIESNNSDNPEIRAFAFSPGQVEIVHDWRAFGLKATDSHSMIVNNQFVADERTFSLTEQLAFLDEPLFSYPFLPFAQATFCAIGIGISRHFLDEAKSLAERRQQAWQSTRAGRYEFIMGLIRQADNQLSSASRTFYETIDQSWNSHMDQQPFTPEEITEISKVCQQTSRTALACVQNLFPYMGISAIMEDEPINQIWRDLQTACQHSLLVPFEGE